MDWMLNLFLFLAWWSGSQTGDFSRYQSLVDAGATCYVETPWSTHTEARPTCFYKEDAK